MKTDQTHVGSASAAGVETLVIEGKKKFQDENLSTCGKVNKTREFFLKERRTFRTMIDLYPQSGDHRQLVGSCRIKDCFKAYWTPEGALRIICLTVPAKRKRYLTVDCTNSPRVPRICEVKVFKILPAMTTSSTSTTTSDTTSSSSTTTMSTFLTSELTTTTSTPKTSTVLLTTDGSKPRSEMSILRSTLVTGVGVTTKAEILVNQTTAEKMGKWTTEALGDVTTDSTVAEEVTTDVTQEGENTDARQEETVTTDVTQEEGMTTGAMQEKNVTTDSMHSSLGSSEGGLQVTTDDPLTLHFTQPQVTETANLTSPELTDKGTRPSVPDGVTVTTGGRVTVVPATVTMEISDGNVTSTQLTSEETTNASIFTTGPKEITTSSMEPVTSSPSDETSPIPSTPTKSKSSPEASPVTATEASSTGGDEKKEKASFGNIESRQHQGNSRNGNGDSGEGSSAMTEVWGAVGAIVVLVALAVVAGIVFKRRQGTRKNKTIGHNDTAFVVDMEMNDRTPSSSKNEEEETEYANMSEPFAPATEPIAVDAFKNHLCYMARVAGFSREYQDLPQGILEPVTAAEEANSGTERKNRFRDISPYDDTRVILKTEKKTDSDYINASYIDGFAEAVAYIAAQGPLPDTVGDFWHMVWTEGCSKIIMLTNLVEGGKVKCEQYWPEMEGSSETFGAYTVTSVHFVQKAHCVRRVLSIAKNSDENTESEPTREVRQFHFTAWPDHGVPCPVALVRFWSHVVLQPLKLGGPMLVHCSAGIGRTGTFIALDMLTHQADTTGKVSIFPTVRRLRKQRVNMVQTVSQYKFLHEVVQEWLSCREGDIVRDDLLHGSRWRVEGGQGEDSTQLPSPVRQQCAAQFQLLTELRPALNDNDTTTARDERNVGKNRSPSILPVEQFRVCLAMSEDEDSDYINAVFLPCESRQQGYMVTQLPLDTTVTDFWRMVWDWRVCSVVRFMDAPQDQGVCMYPDKGQSVQYGALSVHTRNKTTFTPGLSVYTLDLNDHSQEMSGTSPGAGAMGQEVRVYCVESQSALSLKDTSVFVSLVHILLPLVSASNQPPIVVQCFDGAGLSCVLCAVLMAVESLQEEERTSPFLLARLIHTARPQAFTTPEQYEFIVRCLLHYTQRIKEVGVIDTVSDDDQGQAVSTEADHIYANL